MDLQRAHVPIGKALAESAVPEPARSVAVTDAGAIPYYSGWTSIDYIGLNDPDRPESTVDRWLDRLRGQLPF